MSVFVTRRSTTRPWYNKLVAGRVGRPGVPELDAQGALPRMEAGETFA
jgi:hypothetical protein